jgi:hypothetical protein
MDAANSALNEAVPSQFQAYIAEAVNDKEKFRELFTSMKAPEDLVAFAEQKGIPLSKEQAEKMLHIGNRNAEAKLSSLSDEDLEKITGGISFAGVFGAIGAIAGAAEVVAIAVAAFNPVGLGVLGITAAGYAASTAVMALGGASAVGLSGAAWGAAADFVWDRLHGS